MQTPAAFKCSASGLNRTCDRDGLPARSERIVGDSEKESVESPVLFSSSQLTENARSADVPALEHSPNGRDTRFNLRVGAGGEYPQSPPNLWQNRNNKPASLVFATRGGYKRLGC